MLRELRQPDGVESSDGGALDERFIAEQNAEAAAGAERYYRAMVRGGSESWNVRDCHMADALDRILRRYDTSAPGPEPKRWCGSTSPRRGRRPGGHGGGRHGQHRAADARAARP